VSKWERGDTMPDIMLLPALANLYKVSIDALIGMDRINSRQTKSNIFNTGHSHLRIGDFNAAIDVYSEALKIFPNDEDVMADFAMSLALDGETSNLARAVELCERILSNNQGEKVHHTTRAALCFIYMKTGDKEKAITTARNLPHTRESRETVLAHLNKEPSLEDINTYLKFIAIGEADEQDVIEIDFGINMVAVCTEFDLLGKIKTLRDEISNQLTDEGYKKLPQIRIRDKVDMEPNRLRVRHYADYLLDKEYTDLNAAADDIIKTLRNLARA
jgi:tetratricopeptide (TPR) repeat protein